MANTELMDTEDELKFYQEVHAILDEAKSKIYEAANNIMTYAYWNVGKRIIEQEQKGNRKAKYGSYLIKRLSQELSDEYGTGFSVANIRNCRQLYLTFPKESYGYSLIGKIHWSHLRTIMRLDDEEERNFYLKEVANEYWSVKELERNIKSGYYKRILSTQFPDKVGQTSSFVKDPYVLEFMGIRDNKEIAEKDVENAIISNLQKFLLELGRGFSFVARQKRITFDGRHFRIDLVFYNYVLKCFVLIDLKVGDLTHQDLGQMQMYVHYYERELMNEGDNPPIGIVLCADKSESVVKYTLPENETQIFASKYKLYLPSEEELLRELNQEYQALESVKTEEIKIHKERNYNNDLQK